MKTVHMVKSWSKFAMLVMLVLVLTLSAGLATEQNQQATNELDGTKIEAVRVMWLTQDSEKAADGTSAPEAALESAEHLYRSAASNSDMRMVYRITADFSGQYDYEPGDITITIPGKVWHGRKYVEKEGQTVGVVDEEELQGTLELPVPAAPSTKADFNWQIIDGNYVLTNTRTIGATSSVSFDVAISGIKAMNIVDMSQSDPIRAHVEVVTNQGNTIEMTSSAITAQIDTIAQLTGVHKDGEVFEEKPEKIPEALLSKLPAGTDANDYVYVRWYTYPNVTSSQPYSLEMRDTLNAAYEMVNGEKKIVSEGIFLGSTQKNGEMPGKEGTDFSAAVGEKLTGSGMQYAHTVEMWSAYLKSDFYVPVSNEPERVYYFENNAVWKLTEADGAAADDDQVTVDKSVTATSKYAPIRFQVPDGSFDVGKTTKNSSSKDYVYGYALNQLEQREDVDVEFVLRTLGQGYAWTAGETQNSEELGKPNTEAEVTQDRFGRLGWKQVTYDTQNFFNFEATPLTAEDYEFKSLRVAAPVKKGYGKTLNGAWDYISGSNLPNPDLIIEYQLNNEEEWLPAAIAMWGEDGLGALKFEEVAEGITASGAVLYFPSNVTGVRHSFTSNVFGGKAADKCGIAMIDWNVYPTITLKASDRVYGIVQALLEESENPTTKLKNDVQMDVYGWVDADGNGTPVLVRDHSASRATFEGARYGATITGSNSYKNDIENQQIVLHYTATVTEQSNLTNRDDYDEAVEAGAIAEDTRAVWYNLLPPHAAPLKDSVKLRSRDTITNIYTIVNYKNTGRTLLVVEAELTPVPALAAHGYADKPQMSFDAVYSWQDLQEYGDGLTNYTVYETLTELPGGTLGTLQGQKGEPDTPLGGNNTATPALDRDIAGILKDLDTNTDEERFLYAKTSTGVTALFYTVSGLEKSVKSDMAGVWSQGLEEQEQVTVYEGQSYTYRLRVSSAVNTSTKDIVIFDSIENYRLPDPGAGSDATKASDYEHAQERMEWTGDWENKGQWRGRLEQVDLSNFAQAGARPVLLYSTIENLQFAETESENDTGIYTTGTYDIANREIWQAAELDENGVWKVPAGIHVTAVAVDVTKKADGTDFVLAPEQSLSAYLKMRAPDDQGSEDAWSAKGAYARVLNDDGTPVMGADGRQQIDWEAAMDPANNMYAHNNSRVRLLQGQTNATTGSTLWQEHYRLIRNDYTRVGIIPQIIKLEKVWQDQNNHDNKRPASVTVSMLRKVTGEAGEAQPVLDEQGNPIKVVLNEENGWKAEFKQLPIANSEGRTYSYSFREDPVEGYEPEVRFLDVGSYRLTNVHPNEQVLLEGEKIWTDENDALGLRPEAITLILYRDGEQISQKTVRVDANGAWKYSFGSRDKYAAGGREYVYTIGEVYVPKYVFDSEDFGQANNTYNPVGALEVTKTLLNATDNVKDRSFTFTLVLLAEKTDENAAAEPLMNQYPYAIYEKEGEEYKQIGSGMIRNGDKFQLKGDQKLVVTDLPSESTYMVMEDESVGMVSTSENAEGFIRAGQTSVASFINEYRTSGTMQLYVNKKLTGASIRRGQFRFELVDMTEGSETYGEVLRVARVNGTKEGDAAGGSGEQEIEALADAIFGQMEYTNDADDKTFHYIVREVDEEIKGYKSDDKEYDVWVDVSDNGNGTMTVTYTITHDTDAVDEMKFENSYEASGELTLRLWKELVGRELKDKEFTFELYRCDAQGNIVGDLISTAHNDADGDIIFDALQFNQSHCSINRNNHAKYTYLVREKQGGDEGIVYSNEEYMVTVSVKDNGDGTLDLEHSFKQYIRSYTACVDCAGVGTHADDATKACVSCNGEGVIPGAWVAGEENMLPVFVNKLQPGSLTITKIVEDRYMSEESFTFHVSLSTEVEELDYLMTGLPPATEDEDQPGDSQPFEPREPKAAVVDTSAQVKATPDDLKGQAYGALKLETNELVFFRSESTTLVNPFDATKSFDASALTATNTRVDAGDGYIYYFVDESSEISYYLRPWNFDDSSRIRSVRTIDYIRPAYGEKFFYNMYLSEIDLSKFDTSLMTSMKEMFAYFSGLESLDLRTFNTSNVKTMEGMFSNCIYSLESLDLSSFDTKQVTDMSNMFYRCYNLKSLDLSSFDTANVTTMRGMFGACELCETVDISTFDTANVVDMSYMFATSGMKELDLAHFNTANVQDMSFMFGPISRSTYERYMPGAAAEKLDLRSFDTGNVRNMEGMFERWRGLYALELDLSFFDTSSVENMSCMFAESGISTLNVSGFDTSNVKDMSSMFANSSIYTLDLSSFDTRNVTDMGDMFYQAYYLSILDVSNFDTSHAPDIVGMFRDCSNLRQIAIGDRTILDRAHMPRIPVERGSGYTGYWENVANENDKLTPEELFESGNNGGVWTWDMLTYEYIFLGGEGTGYISRELVVDVDYYCYIVPKPYFYRYGYELIGFRKEATGQLYEIDASDELWMGVGGEQEGDKVYFIAEWKKMDPNLTINGNMLTLTLKNNQTVTLNNLPAGTTYQVWEDMPTYWKQVSKSGDSGIIGAKQTSEAVFTNESDWDNQNYPQRITLTKTLDGRIPEVGEFTFTMKDESGNVVSQVTNSVGGAVLFDQIEIAPESTADYIIQEEKGNNPAIIYDDSQYVVRISHSYYTWPSLTTMYGKLVDGQVADDAWSDEPPVFRNTSVPGSLTISKATEGEVSAKAAEQDFTFEVTLTGADGKAWTGDENGNVLVDGVSKTITDGKVTVKLKDGESVTLTNVPAGVKYEVTETVPAGWTQTEAEGAEGTIAANAE
ncbi:MAG: BspA family leucine-rich repeat surface protein, partial [Clostridia bacterium]|nr:BspA family leucine-rich repeat surface protein [Clostridia bacterium]